MSFSDLGLSDELLRAVADAGYDTPTPIQAQAIPQVLMGRDILGSAQTGTGKTASFTLPMIDILASGTAKARMPRSLILEPTRELAAQVADNFETYGKYHKLNHALLIGGENMSEQLKVLEKGVDVLIATPGRLMDVFDRGHLLLRDVKILVIDESDRMLDMGFIPDVEKIVSLLPPLRTTLLFSATMPPPIKRLADQFLMNPKEISVSKPATAAETITQGLLMVTGAGRDQTSIAKAKRAALRKLIERENPKNAIIFCNRKRDVDIVYRSLQRHGYEKSARLHGDMVQSVRMETLEKFKNDEVTLLVCSDVAARGLDIPAMSHVFNFDIPTHSDDYIHRIGRTGRAGLEGVALSLAIPADGKYIDGIERLTNMKIPRISLDGRDAPVTEEAEAQADSAPETEKQESATKERSGGGRKRGRRRGGRGEKRGDSAESVSSPQTQSEDKPAAEAKPNPPSKPKREPAKSKSVRTNDAPQKKSPESSQDRPERKAFGDSDQVPDFLKGGF